MLFQRVRPRRMGHWGWGVCVRAGGAGAVVPQGRPAVETMATLLW